MTFIDDPLRLSLARGPATATSPSMRLRAEGEAGLCLGSANLVRHRLREATAAVHEALHHAKPFARIAEGSIDMAGYGDVLEMLYRFHASMRGHVEAGSVALGAPDLAFAHQMRLAALEEDLCFVARARSVVMPDAAEDEIFSLGCLYTLQGSTLGGKVIFRQLDVLLGHEKGRRFFQGGPRDGALWQRLCAGLEEFATDYALLEDGAAHAFARFASLLDT